MKNKCFCEDCEKVRKYNAKARKQFEKFLDFLIIGFGCLAGFSTINFILQSNFPNVEFGLSFGFWGFCLLLVIWWLPTKKERKNKKRDYIIS